MVNKKWFYCTDLGKILWSIGDFNLKVKYVTFNHHYVGSSPTGLKKMAIG